MRDQTLESRVLCYPASDDEKEHWLAVARPFDCVVIVPVPDQHPKMSRNRCYPVALLHDVVEDNYDTMENVVKDFWLDDEQSAALDAITRREGERYFDYIERVKRNDMAKAIKLVDLQENIKRSANDLPNRWGLLRRYAKAYAILTDKWVYTDVEETKNGK